MSELETKLIIEEEELHAKHKALDLFIKKGKIFPELEELERVRLRKQHFAMGEYLKILNERLHALKLSQ